MRRTALAAIAMSVLMTPLGCTKAQPTKEGFCRELRRTRSVAEVLAGLSSDDPTSIGRRAEEGSQQFARLERSAPRDIRSEVTEVGNLVEKVAEAVSASPDDPRAIATALRSQALDSAGVLVAAIKLIDYGRKTCDYDIVEASGLTSSSTSGTTVPAPPTT